MSESVNSVWCSRKSNFRMSPYSKHLVGNHPLAQKKCLTPHRSQVHAISSPPINTMVEATCWTQRWTWISRQSSQRIITTGLDIIKGQQVARKQKIKKYQVTQTLLNLNNQSGQRVVKQAMRSFLTFVTRSSLLVVSWTDMSEGSSLCRTS